MAATSSDVPPAQPPAEQTREQLPDAPALVGGPGDGGGQPDQDQELGQLGRHQVETGDGRAHLGDPHEGRWPRPSSSRIGCETADRWNQPRGTASGPRSWFQRAAISHPILLLAVATPLVWITQMGSAVAGLLDAGQAGRAPAPRRAGHRHLRAADQRRGRPTGSPSPACSAGGWAGGTSCWLPRCQLLTVAVAVATGYLDPSPTAGSPWP